MAICPGFYSELSLPALKDITKLESHHPWEKSIKPIYSNRIKHAHNSIINPVYPKPKKQDNKNLIKFTVIGIRTNKDFIYCANLVKKMHKFRPKTFDVPVIKAVTATEWPFSWNNMKMYLGGSTYCITTPVVILKDGEYFGGDKELKEFMESKYIYRICLNYRKEAMQDFVRYVKSTGRPFVYMRISIDENPIGTLIFMLYSDIAPNTCENFIRLCRTRKGGYSGTPIHRIVKDGWIQCGGFGLKDTNLGCENFIVPHDARGVLGMCNADRDVDCSTQFFVLLQPNDWMNHRYVAFGQLIDGEKTLKHIETVPTFYESPTSSIIIVSAGVLDVDCKNISINKGAREYLNKHIEDLIETKEFFTELLLQRLWAEIEAGRQKRKLASSDSADCGCDWVSLASIQNDEADKENNEYANSSYTMYEMEEVVYSQVTASILPSVKLKTKPFYLPLTDVPYPGEVDSTFDLKKFLKGDYCHESDLQKDLKKDGKEREVIKLAFSKLPSDAFIFDEDDDDRPSSSLDSSEEEEIRNFIRDNVDRVSFAGGIIRNIAALRRGNSMFNLFEGVRKSEYPNLTDEDIRKLRCASIFERGTTDTLGRRQTAKKLFEVAARLPRLASSAVDVQSKLGSVGTLPKLADDTEADKSRSALKFGSKVLSHEQIKILKQISRLASKQKTKDQETESQSSTSILSGIPPPPTPLPDVEKPRESSNKEAFDKKRRQTVFSKELTRVKRFSTERFKKPTIRFPSGTEERINQIKRRQTGFIPHIDVNLEEINIEEDYEDQDTDLESDIAEDAVQQRASLSVPKDELPDIDDENVSLHKASHVTKKDTNAEAEIPEDVQRRSTALHKATGFKDLNIDEVDKDMRESVFLRFYEPEPGRDTSPPQLKDYKPLSKTTPEPKYYLKLGKTIPIEPTDIYNRRDRLIRSSQGIDIDASLANLAKIRGARAEGKISSDYMATLDKNLHSRIRSPLTYTSKRPFMTVKEYQKENEERLRQIKNAEESKTKILKRLLK